MRILYLPCHAVLEYDELRLFASLGHEIASIGAYIDPAHPHVDTRPALPEVPMVELVKREVDALGQQGHTDTLDAAKRHIPDALIDWAEVIIVAGFEHSYLIPQWERLRHKRVIWRTIGQSGDRNEQSMRPLFEDGCQIVRYSPKERNIPHFAGESALIRFYKDPDDWNGWIGDIPEVANISQGLYQRSLADDGFLQPKGYQWTSYEFWQEATRGLPTMRYGPDTLGSMGPCSYDMLRAHLRHYRAYLYTGTQPASYTLGLIEAMMTGIPVVSIGPQWYRILPYGGEMFEGHELTGWTEQNGYNPNDPEEAAGALRLYLDDYEMARETSFETRLNAIRLFGRDKIARQWTDFLAGREVKSDYEQFVQSAKTLVAA